MIQSSFIYQIKKRDEPPVRAGGHEQGYLVATEAYIAVILTLSRLSVPVYMCEMQMGKSNCYLSGPLEQNQSAAIVTLEVLHLSQVNKTDTTQFSYLRSPPAETRVTFNRQILLLSVRVRLKNKGRRRENEH